MADNVDNTLILGVLKELRADMREQRILLLQTGEHTRRLQQLMETQFLAMNQRISGLKDDLELMLKSELMGRLGNFETRIENLIERRLDQKAE